jgi:RND family efflux transporter MFP subunit
MKRAGVWFAATAGFLTLIAGCGEKIGPGQTAPSSGPAVKAAVATARAEACPLVFEAVGTVQAETASTVAAKLMGTVKAVRVKEGDRVQRGDVLATIDERQVIAQRRQAEAALSEAREAEQAARAGREAAAAGAELALATQQRYRTMLDRESVSRQEFEEIDARRRQAQAALAQAEDLQRAAGQQVQQAAALLAAAHVSAGDADVTAPFDGIVAAKMIEPGDLAAPGKPMFKLEKTGGHRVDILIPEAIVRLVGTGQAVAVRIESPAALSLEGFVDTVAPAADAGSRSFLAKVRLPVGADLRSGMFARVALTIGEDRVTAIPVSAVIQEGQLSGIFVLTPENVARFRLIRTGRRMEDRIEVLSGLSDGSRFVVNPAPGLVDGATVETSS